MIRFAFLLPLACFAAKTPTVVSGLPTVASTESTTFTFTGRDADGAGDIARMYWLIADSPDILQNGCHGFYDRAANALYLYDDTLVYPLGPIALGAAGAVKNGQCTANGAGAAAVASGTDLALTVTLGITQQYGALGRKVYLWVKDKTGRETGWVQTGTWEPIPAPHPPITETRTQLDEYFTLASSLNQWVTLAHTPSRGTLIDVWFIGKSGNEDRWIIRPRLDFDDPKRVELVTGEPGEVMLLYWSDEQ